MEPKKLYRSKESRMVCGVCGGIAEYFNIDPTLIRLGFVLGACASFGTMDLDTLLRQLLFRTKNKKTE